MNKKILKELKDMRLILLGITIFVFMVTFGFLFVFAAPGLYEAEHQYPHAYDGHKFLNYNTFNSFMYVVPIIGMGTLIVLALIFVIPSDNKKPKTEAVK